MSEATALICENCNAWMYAATLCLKVFHFLARENKKRVRIKNHSKHRDRSPVWRSGAALTLVKGMNKLGGGVFSLGGGGNDEVVVGMDWWVWTGVGPKFIS